MEATLKDQLLLALRESCDEYLEYSINLDSFMSTLEVYFDICNTRPFQNDSERKLAFDNTIKEYLDDNILADSPILLETFDFLSKHDRIAIKNNQPFLYLFDMFLDNLVQHSLLIEKYNNDKKELDTINKTIALSTSHSPSKMVSPINKLTKQNILNKDNISSKVLSTIRDDFINNKYLTNFYLTGFSVFQPNDFIGFDKEPINALYNSKKFFNSAVPIEIKDILHSIQTYFIVLYMSTSIFTKMLKIDKPMSLEQLGLHLHVIMEHIFETKKSIIVDNINKKEFQIRTYYEDYPLLEVVRKGKKRINPIYQMQDYHNILEKIKGKLPENHPFNKFLPLLKSLS